MMRARRACRKGELSTLIPATRSWRALANAASIWVDVAAYAACATSPSERAAASTDGMESSRAKGSPRLRTALPLGSSSASSSRRFEFSGAEKMLIPVTLPPGRPRLAARPAPDGLAAGRHDRHMRVGSERGVSGNRPERDDHRGFQHGKLGGKPGKLLGTSGVTGLDDDVAVFDMPAVPQPVAQRLQGLDAGRWRPHGPQQPDPAWLPGRLPECMRHDADRAERGGARDQHQQTPLHSITSSARSSSDCASVSPSDLTVFMLTMKT